MKSSTKTILGILGAIVLLIIIIVATIAGQYNSLVALKGEVDKQYSTIDVQLQRRSDLIPNLVNTVKGFNIQELAVIDSVTDARAKLAGAGTDPEKRIAAEEEVSGALSRLLVVVENYPELKSDKNYTQLMDELSGTENRIAVSRIDYNDAVTKYNIKIKSFPTTIIAGMFNFQSAKIFEATAESKIVPVVDFTK